MNFFQVLQSAALLKNEKKSSQKRWKPPKNYLKQQETEEKHSKNVEKRKMGKNQATEINAFYSSTFL